MPDGSLEAVDARILDTLQSDGRLTNQALADRVGMSTSPCWRRVNRLEQDGVIAGYRAVLDRQKLGLEVLAFVRVKIDSHNADEAEAFSRGIMRLNEVVACYSVAGDAGFPAAGGGERSRCLCRLRHDGHSSSATHQGNADDNGS